MNQVSLKLSNGVRCACMFFRKGDGSWMVLGSVCRVSIGGSETTFPLTEEPAVVLFCSQVFFQLISFQTKTTWFCHDPIILMEEKTFFNKEDCNMSCITKHWKSVYLSQNESTPWIFIYSSVWLISHVAWKKAVEGQGGDAWEHPQA